MYLHITWAHVCISSFKKRPFISTAHLLTELIGLLSLLVLYILQPLLPLNKYLAKIFLLFYGLSLHSIDCSFAEEKHFDLPYLCQLLLLVLELLENPIQKAIACP